MRAMGPPVAPEPKAPAKPAVPHAGHPDRRDLPPWLLTALVVATATATGIAGHTVSRARLDPSVGFAAGVFVAMLAIFGLPSLSIRLVARGCLGLSAILLLRFGLAGGPGSLGGQALVAWPVAAVAVFVLTDRIGTDANPPLTGGSDPRVAALPTLRTIAAIAAVVVLLAILLAPRVASHVGRDAEPGKGPNLDSASAGTSLRANRSLDMTTRPDLTDQVVFTVDSNRQTFWRGEVYDTWDGRTWTRSEPSVERLVDDREVIHEADDLGADGSDVVRQRFRMATDYASVLYAAASATSVTADAAVAQHPDGTLIGGPLGQGATYTVVSRRVPLSPTILRNASRAVPSDVATRYAATPVATDRVVAAAKRVTASATTTYDKVLALEDWMGGRTKYSLDAPLAPKGVDVVDHFLFTSKEGWCEQIASSLVVLARAAGIPARLVTGFVPGEQDPVTGTFTVRARDAHAWAEVWFAGIGWVPFDPTADVPLAGNDKASTPWSEWLLHHAVYLVLAIGAIAVLVGPVRMLVRRVLARRRERPDGWAAIADAALDRLGARADRARSPDETAAAYAAALAERYDDPRLVEVGTLLDDALFAADPPGPDRTAWADAVLDDLAKAEPRSAEPVAAGATPSNSP